MNKQEAREKAWEEFYNSKKAQEYCFGNYNNATRDEHVGEFSFNAGYDAGAIAERERMLRIMVRGGYFSDNMEEREQFRKIVVGEI